jgi:hypothetical protein
MSSNHVSARPVSRRFLRLSGVDWKGYSQFVRLFAERPGFHIPYDQGELEIMSPTLEHDDDAWFLGRMVIALTEELELPLHSGGSTTMKRKLLARGIEADACFWIANAHRMAGRRRLEARERISGQTFSPVFTVHY